MSAVTIKPLGGGVNDGVSKEFEALEKIAANLPNDWLVCWGKEIIPPDETSRESDFIVVGKSMIFICELKNWGGRWSAAYRGSAWEKVTSQEKRADPVAQVHSQQKKLMSVFKKNVDQTLSSFWSKFISEPSSIKGRPDQKIECLVVVSGQDFELSNTEGSIVFPPKQGDDIDEKYLLYPIKSIEGAIAYMKRIDSAKEVHLKRDNKTSSLSDPNYRESLKNWLKGFKDRTTEFKLAGYSNLKLIGKRGNLTKYHAYQKDKETNEFLILSIALTEEIGTRRDYLARIASVNKKLHELSDHFVIPKISPGFKFGDAQMIIPIEYPNRTRYQSIYDLCETAPIDHDLFCEVFEAGCKSLGLLERQNLNLRSLNPKSIKVPLENGSLPHNSKLMFVDFESALENGDLSETVNSSAEFDDWFTPVTSGDLLDLYSLVTSVLTLIAPSIFDELNRQSIRDKTTFWVSKANELLKTSFPEPFVRYINAILEVRQDDIPTLDTLIEAIWDVPIDNSDLEALGFYNSKFIAMGSAGTVYRSEFSVQVGTEALPIAVKVFDRAIDSEVNRKNANAELVILRQLMNSSFPRLQYPLRDLRSEFRHGDKLVIATTFLSRNRSFKEHMRTLVERDDFREINRLVRRGFEALNYLHVDRGLVHCDIKPENIIIYSDLDLERDELCFIDMGQAGKIGIVKKAGTPRFTDVLVGNYEYPWRPTHDLYSLALSFIFALTGRYPFEVDGSNDVNRCEVRASRGPEKLRETLSVLERLLDPVEDRRIVDAAGVIKELTQPLNIPKREKSELDFVSNPVVQQLRNFYIDSRRGGTAAVDIGGEYGKRTYVETTLDTKLKSRILDGEFDLVLLSGNPGDGKTVFLDKIEDALLARAAVLEDGSKSDGGWNYKLGSRSLIAIRDASQSVGDKSPNDYCRSKMASLSRYSGNDTGSTVLVAANDGRLLDLFDSMPFKRIHEIVKSHLLSQDLHIGALPRLLIIDFKRRALVDPVEPDKSIFVKLVEKTTEARDWAICEECRVQDSCPIRFNAKSLSVIGKNSPVERMHYLLEILHLRKRARVTMRNLRSFISFAITADLSCEEVHQEFKNGGNPLEKVENLYFWSVLAGTPENVEHDAILTPFAEIEPGKFNSPKIERELLRWMEDGWDEKGPDALNSETSRPYVRSSLRTDDVVTALQITRRRAFFELGSSEWGTIGTPFRFLKEYRELLSSAPDSNLRRDALESLLCGISKIVGLSYYKGSDFVARNTIGLKNGKLSPDSYFLKKYPKEKFSLGVTLPSEAFLDSIADELKLRFDGDKGVLSIGIDMFELLISCANGIIPSHSEISALIQEVHRFSSLVLRAGSIQGVINSKTEQEWPVFAIDNRIIGGSSNAN